MNKFQNQSKQLYRGTKTGFGYQTTVHFGTQKIPFSLRGMETDV